jgi:hypothetical protein
MLYVMEVNNLNQGWVAKVVKEERADKVEYLKVTN